MSVNLQPIAARVASFLVTAGPVVNGVAAVSSGTPIGAIVEVILQLPTLINLADEVLNDVAGPQKLAAVQAALKAGLTALDPALEANFEKAWAILSPVVSFIVTLRKFGIHV